MADCVIFSFVDFMKYQRKYMLMVDMCHTEHDGDFKALGAKIDVKIRILNGGLSVQKSSNAMESIKTVKLVFNVAET